MLFTFRKLLHHYASATLIDVLHSPFVFGLYNQCFKKNSSIQLSGFTPASQGYFNQRNEAILEKIKHHFAGHYVTSKVNDLPTDKPFIFLAEKEIPIDIIRQKLNSAHNDSMVIVRYIYTTPEQCQYWEQLKNIPAVTASVDLFFTGILFVRKEQRRQAFRLRIF